MRQHVLHGLAATLCAVLAAPALADPAILPPITTVIPPQRNDFDCFGDHVSAWADGSTDWLFVGAPRARSKPGGADGYVHIYQRTPGGYALVQSIAPKYNSARGTGGDRFGAGITVRDGRMIVGAANDQSFPGLIDPVRSRLPNIRSSQAKPTELDDARPSSLGDPPAPFYFAGKAYAYALSGGTCVEEQTLASPDPGSFQGFSARTDSAHTVFGATAGLAVIAEAGQSLVNRLHVYRHRMGAFERVQTVTTPTALPGEVVGASAQSTSGRAVALGGFGDKLVHAGNDYFLVSAEAERGASNQFNRDVEPTRDLNHAVAVLGMVLLYGPSGDGLTSEPIQVLTAPAGFVKGCPASFGFAGMAAGNGLVVIADPCDSAAGSNAGALHVYRFYPGANQPLVKVAYIPHPMPTASAFLGKNFGVGSQTLTTDGARIVVSAPEALGESNPDVYVFEEQGSGWILTSILRSPDVAPWYFGQSVRFVGGGRVAVGQFGDDVGLKGRLHIYDLGP